MSHKQNDIWLETMEEVMKPMECGACGEVSLRYQETTDTAPFIETWECDCGHIRCFHVTAKLTSVTRGWGKNISHAYHCTACGSKIDLTDVLELELQKQHEAALAWDEESILQDLEENNASTNTR